MQNDSSIALDYATVAIARKQRKWPLSGIYSLIFILIQVPWGVFWLGVAFDLDDPKNDLEFWEFLFFIVIAAPTLLSVMLGCYSLWIAGITSRNTSGVVGLAYVVLEVVWILHNFMWAAIARFPIILSTSAVVLSLVLWQVVKKVSKNRVRIVNNHRGRDLFNVMFTTLAALPLPAVLVILLQREPSVCVWSWDEPQQQIADNIFSRGPSHPGSETTIAPGIQRLRTPIQIQDSKGFYAQYECEIRVATELLVMVLAVLPVSWAVFRLPLLLRWMAH